MAEASYPFDGGSGSIITEQQWSNMSATWQDDGVIAVGPSSTALKVTTLNQVGIVYVEVGEANVLGFHYENTAQLPVAVPSNLTALTRIDLVVLQLDKNTNAVRVAYRQGLAASSPVPPTLVTTGGVYEIALAQIQMNPNTTQVPNTEPQLVDKRTFVGKRIQPTEDLATIPVGSIGYKPSDGKFYAKNGSGTLALGAPPDLSGYATTASLSGYSPTSHLHTGVYSDVGHTHAGGGTGPTIYFKVRTTTQALSSGISANDSVLQFALPANPTKKFLVEGVIYLISATAGANFQFALTTPSGGAADGRWHMTHRTGTSVSPVISGTGFGVGVPGVSAPVSNGLSIVEFSGTMFERTSAGNFLLLYSAPTAAITIQQGSWLRLTEII